LFQQVRVNGFDDEAMAKALGALNAAARLRSLQPAGDLQPLTGLLTHPSEPVRLEAARLAGAWKGPGDSAALLLRLVSPSTPTPALRDVVLTSLREIGGPKAADALVQLTTEKAAPEMRRQAATALAAIDLKRAVPTLVELLSDVTVEADALALWRSLLNIKGAASVLAKALPKSGLNQTMAKAGLRVAREGSRNEPDLVLALSRGAELDQGEVTLTEAELKQLVTDVQKAGDPVRGEIVYRRKELSCVACHSIGGAGGKVGPDMTSIGASAPVDYLIESVWFPNKKIKEGYHAVMVETKDGQEFSGTLLRETGEQLILRDASDKEVPIARNNVQDQRMSTLSLMPAGLIDGITSAERVDLFRFLSELGKPGPFDASKGNVARAWKLRPGIHVEEQKIEGGLPFNDLNGRNWLLAYSNVDGRVPANVLREGAVVANKYIGVVALYAVAQFEMARATSVKLRLTGGDDASLWIDGKPVPANAELTVNLGAGSHTVAVRLDPKKLPDFLKLEASEGTFVVP
jgi:putative heme-binding domain-containing protein